MIIITKYPTQTVELFDPKGVSLGFLNEHEMIDVRIQVKCGKLEGYYCLFNDKPIAINIDGNYSHWPEGFFDTSDRLLSILYGC